MRRVLALQTLALLAFGGSLAVAQPKPVRPATPAVSQAPPATPVEEKTTPTPMQGEPGRQAENAQALPDGDLGPPPVTTPETGSASKLSPLTPAPDEFAKGGAAFSPTSFDQLLGDIAALRSRVMALTTTLFKSKLRVIVETRGNEARIDALGVTLDDGVVFAAPERFNADDERVVYEHAVAPGHHVLGIDVERYDARNKQYRTWQSSRFSLVIPESQLVEAHVVIEDASDMAQDFAEDQDGKYELSVRLRARVTEP